MANITIEVKGLTGTLHDITIDDGLTWSNLRTSIAALEGGSITTSYYGQETLERDPSINSSGSSTTTFAANGIVTGDRIICRPRRNPATNTKEARADQKLYIAEAKRQGLAAADTSANYYRTANTYDKTLLPNPYEGDAYNPDDDENTGVLEQKRPWATGALAAPASVEEAVSGAALVDLQIWYDASDTSTLIPSATDEGQITQWTDKSAFAHNANPNGGSAKPTYEDTTPQNSYGYIEFDGNDNLNVNPFTALQSAAGFSVFVVSKLANTTGTQYITETDQNDLRISANGTGIVVGMAGATGTVASEADTNWAVHSLIYDGTQAGNATRLVYRKDKTAKTLTFTGTVAATTDATNTTFYIGEDAAMTSGMEGYVAEVLLFNRTLTSTEYANIENYLTNKWGL